MGLDLDFRGRGAGALRRLGGRAVEISLSMKDVWLQGRGPWEETWLREIVNNHVGGWGVRKGAMPRKARRALSSANSLALAAQL